MTKVIIIDDESNCVSTLELLIARYCPDLEIVATANSADEGFEKIIQLKPALIFLDIEMPHRSGFELLEQLKMHPISVIFTTAYSQHAIRAIKYSALDYLLKPIDPNDLVEAIQRYRQYKSLLEAKQVQTLMEKLAAREELYKKIAIPNMEGFNLISVDQIIACEADDNYTDIKMKDNQKLTASRTLKDIESLLEESNNFLRIHHSFLINLKEIKQYIKGEGGHVIMSDGTEYKVSRSKKEILMQYLLSRNI